MLARAIDIEGALGGLEGGAPVSMTAPNEPQLIVPKGYVVFDLEITDPQGYEQYRLEGQATTRLWGGRVLSGEPAPRGVVEPLEGEWDTKRLVINEFPTVEIARGWFRSERYQAAARHRQATADGRVLLVEGWGQPW